MLRSNRLYVFYKRDVLQNVVKFTEKVPEPVFNKGKLGTLLKKTPTQVFLVNFSKSLRATFL